MPFIGWTEDFPLVGSYATRALQYWTNSFATIVMRKTGEQFFLLDGSDRSEPLLVGSRSVSLFSGEQAPADAC